MLAVKYQSKRICEISTDQIPLHAKSLLVRINTITGWRLPDDEFFLNVLVDEFQKYLVENYSDLNPDEISYAFRSYGTTVKDWGKSMNLSLIDEPIRKYISVRQCLSEIEERRTAPIEFLLPMHTDWKELCETFYQQYLSGKYNIAFWPHEMYDEFVSAGMLSADVFEDHLQRAQSYLVGKKKGEILKEEVTTARENILYTLTSELSKLETASEPEKINQWAKRFAVQYLYYKANESGYKNLFIKA